MTVQLKIDDPALSSAPAGAAAPARIWRVSMAIAGAGALAVVALYWDTVAAMVGTWSNSTAYNHGFLILPVSGYLVWERRHQLARLAPKATFWGVAAVAAAAVLWLLGAVAGARVIQQFAFVMTLQGLVLGVFGWQVSRALLFPLGYLFLAVPFGDFLIAPLQDVTAAFVVRGLQLIGIPVYLEGIFIYIPSGAFEVSEACAGLRYLIASIALGVLFANLTYRSWPRRAAFLGLTLAVPIVANGLRALGIVLLAYYSNNQIAVGFDHIIYGWLFFAVVTMILLSLGMTFRDKPLGEDTPLATPTSSAAGSRLAAVFVATAAVLVVAGASGYAVYSDRQGADGTDIRLAAPAVPSPWRPTVDPNEDWRPQFVGADAELRRVYVAEDGRRVVLFVAFYARQREGAELVNWANTIPGEAWTRAGSGKAEARIDGKVRPVAYTRMMSPSGRRLVWSWYWVGGRFTADPSVAKILQVKARLLGGNPAAAVVAVAADYDETPAQAVAPLRSFIERVPSWRAALEGAVRP